MLKRNNSNKAPKSGPVSISGPRLLPDQFSKNVNNSIRRAFDSFFEKRAVPRREAGESEEEKMARTRNTDAEVIRIFGANHNESDANAIRALNDALWESSRWTHPFGWVPVYSVAFVLPPNLITILAHNPHHFKSLFAVTSGSDFKSTIVDIDKPQTTTIDIKTCGPYTFTTKLIRNRLMSVIPRNPIAWPTNTKIKRAHSENVLAKRSEGEWPLTDCALTGSYLPRLNPIYRATSGLRGPPNPPCAPSGDRYQREILSAWYRFASFGDSHSYHEIKRTTALEAQHVLGRTRMGSFSNREATTYQAIRYGLFYNFFWEEVERPLPHGQLDDCLPIIVENCRQAVVRSRSRSRVGRTRSGKHNPETTRRVRAVGVGQAGKGSCVSPLALLRLPLQDEGLENREAGSESVSDISSIHKVEPTSREVVGSTTRPESPARSVKSDIYSTTGADGSSSSDNSDSGSDDSDSDDSGDSDADDSSSSELSDSNGSRTTRKTRTVDNAKTGAPVIPSIVAPETQGTSAPEEATVVPEVTSSLLAEVLRLRVELKLEKREKEREKELHREVEGLYLLAREMLDKQMVINKRLTNGKNSLGYCGLESEESETADGEAADGLATLVKARNSAASDEGMDLPHLFLMRLWDYN